VQTWFRGMPLAEGKVVVYVTVMKTKGVEAEFVDPVYPGARTLEERTKACGDRINNKFMVAGDKCTHPGLMMDANSTWTGRPFFVVVDLRLIVSSDYVLDQEEEGKYWVQGEILDSRPRDFDFAEDDSKSLELKEEIEQKSYLKFPACDDGTWKRLSFSLYYRPEGLDSSKAGLPELCVFLMTPAGLPYAKGIVRGPH
jgi:hypothetical protein